MDRLPLPDYLPTPVGDYRLVIYDPLGEAALREFDRGSGVLAGEIVAIVSTTHGSKSFTFAGDYKKIACDGGEVVQLFLDDGDGLEPTAYGAITKLRQERGGVQPYTVNTDELLNGRDADDKVYLNADPAAIALDLVTRCKHPAIRAPRADDFPTSGVTTPRFDACGDALGDALKRLADLAAPSGKSYGYGLDGNGFPFFKPNDAVVTIPYESDAYTGLETDAEMLATAIRYVVLGEPTITPYAGGYQPKTLNYVAIPDQALHDRYRRRRGRAAPTNIFERIDSATVAAVGFSNPDNATSPGASELTTPAIRTATTGSPSYALLNDDPNVYGVRLLYRMDDAVPTCTIRFKTQHANGAGPYYEAELPKSDQELKPIEILAPPGVDSANGAFAYFSRFELKIPVGGTFELYVAHLLRLDVARLDSMARLDTKLPARQPAQLTPKRRVGRNLRGYLVELAPTIALTGTPWGDQIGESPEYRYAFTPGAGVYTVIDLGTAARSGEAAQARIIRIGLERDLEAQKIANARSRRV